MLNALAPNLPGLIGGSADLAPSNMTLMKVGAGAREAGGWLPVTGLRLARRRLHRPQPLLHVA